MLLGTVVNTLAIAAGGLIGLFFSGLIPRRHSDTMLQALAFAIILMGFKMAWKTDDFILLVLSLALGSGAGGLIGIEDRLGRLGKLLQNRFSKSGTGISNAFVFTSLLYCVGPLAIVGSLESGLSGNHDILLAKSLLDGLGSVLFAAAMGVGVLFSAVPVFLYQGALTVGASFAEHLLTPGVVDGISAVGGLLIVAIGFNMLGVCRVKVGDMLPAVVVPLLYHAGREALRLFT
jgi:uncharacterized protein